MPRRPTKRLAARWGSNPPSLARVQLHAALPHAQAGSWRRPGNPARAAGTAAQPTAPHALVMASRRFSPETFDMVSRSRPVIQVIRWKRENRGVWPGPCTPRLGTESAGFPAKFELACPAHCLASSGHTPLSPALGAQQAQGPQAGQGLREQSGSMTEVCTPGQRLGLTVRGQQGRWAPGLGRPLTSGMDRGPPA